MHETRRHESFLFDTNQKFNCFNKLCSLIVHDALTLTTKELWNAFKGYIYWAHIIFMELACHFLVSMITDGDDEDINF